MKLIALICVLCSGALAQDYEAAALAQLAGKPVSPTMCFVDNNGDGIRDGIVGAPGITMEQVKAAALDPVLRAATDAAIMAAETNRLATPIVYDQPIQARIETPATDGHVYGIEVDATGGELIPVQRESTRLTQAEYDAARAAKLAERATHRATMAAIKTDLDQVEAALDQVDVTTTGPLGLAITATTGVNKAALTEVRKVLVDLKVAVKNLRQASEWVRREIR